MPSSFPEPPSPNWAVFGCAVPAHRTSNGRPVAAASQVLRRRSAPRPRACMDRAFGFPYRSGCLFSPGGRRGLSVLARVVSRRAHGFWTTPDLPETRAIVPGSVGFPLGAHGRHPEYAFRSSIPGPSIPLSALHPEPYGSQHKTRGQDGSLLLSCGASFIPCYTPGYPRACAPLQSQLRRGVPP